MKHCLTFDVDWAPDFVIEDTLNLLDHYGVSATFFLTHRTGLSFEPHEVGIHPVFSQGGDWRRAVLELMEICPEARGARAHSLTFGFRIFELYREVGIRYLSDYYCHKVPGLRPFELYQGIRQYPIWFMDDGHIEHFGNGCFDWQTSDFSLPQLRVLGFHPIHIYLNTDTMARYREAAKSLHDRSGLDTFVNKGPGIRTMLIELLRNNLLVDSPL